MTALYVIIGIALTTARVPLTDARSSAEGMQDSILVLNICYHVAAAWLSFFGIFWDVQLRKREWALIRLGGGHPSFIAGFQYFCLSLLGALIGGGFGALLRFRHGIDSHRVLGIGIWGFSFFILVSLGPVAYTELFDIVPVIRIEGNAGDP